MKEPELAKKRGIKRAPYKLPHEGLRRGRLGKELQEVKHEHSTIMPVRLLRHLYLPGLVGLSNASFYGPEEGLQKACLTRVVKAQGVEGVDGAAHPVHNEGKPVMSIGPNMSLSVHKS